MVQNLQKHTSILEIPITVKIIGNPELLASKLFDGKKDPKTGKPQIPRSILVEDEIECRLKEILYRDEVDAPQDVLIVFGITGSSSKSSLIASFLYEKLKDFKKTSLFINKTDVKISYDLIHEMLEEMRS